MRENRASIEEIKKSYYNKNRNEEIQQIIDALEDPLSTNELSAFLKLQADSLMRGTFSMLLDKDNCYDEQASRIRNLIKEYESMDLPREQRALIDDLLLTKDEIQFDEVTLAYKAGMIDQHRVLKMFGLTRE